MNLQFGKIKHTWLLAVVTEILTMFDGQNAQTVNQLLLSHFDKAIYGIIQQLVS